MNLKPINEVPEVEALQEGDKILINSNGAAMQIAASKVGGSGGGVGAIYGAIQMDDNGDAFITAYADKEMTVSMTYAEGKAMAESGMRLCVDMTATGTDGWMYLFPIALPIDLAKAIQSTISVGGDALDIMILFTDTLGFSSEEG